MNNTSSIADITPNSTAPVLGEEEWCVDIFDGVQITWHETRGYALRVIVDDDLNAKDAMKLAEAIRLGAAHMDAMKNAREGRSIWKLDNCRMFKGSGLRYGPGSRLADVGSIVQAKYSEARGVRIWFEIEPRLVTASEYSVAEIRKLHKAMGRVLSKVDAEPTPTADS